MPKLAIVIGVLLIAAGLAGYFGAGRVSLTALIPAAFGLVLAGLGGVGYWKPSGRKHAMHAAAAIALLGLLGSIQGIPQFFALLVGDDVERPWAAAVQTVTVVLTVVFVGAAVWSFLQARNQQAEKV